MEQTLLEVGLAIAKELGDEWIAEPPNFVHVYDTDRWVQIHAKNNPSYSLLVNRNYEKKGMYHIKGELELYDSSYGLEWKEQHTSINVSQEKTPKQIAADIQRRLLPTYYDQWKRNREYIAKRIEYNTRTDNTRSAAQQIIADWRQSKQGTETYIDLKHAGKDSIDVHISHLSVGQLQKIIDILKGA